MDFGLARRVERQSFTAAGSVLGTPEYMSPEQAKGEKADCRSDLYSAGVLLFEMLAGRPPFQGRDTIAILRQHVETPAPALSEFVPEVPPRIDRMVAKLLAKRAEERYAHVGALRTDMAAFLPQGDGSRRIVLNLLRSVDEVISKPTRPAHVGQPAEFEEQESSAERGERVKTWVAVTAAAIAVMALGLAIAALARGSAYTPATPPSSGTSVVPRSSGPVWRKVILRNGESFDGTLVRTGGPPGQMVFEFEDRDGRPRKIAESELRYADMLKGGEKP